MSDNPHTPMPEGFYDAPICPRCNGGRAVPDPAMPNYYFRCPDCGGTGVGTTAPRYDHGCPDCKFLGREGNHDLYFCAKPDRPVLLAIFGNQYYHYAASEPDKLNQYPVLGEALKRAVEQGLINPRYQHDSANSVFLGRHNEYDLYCSPNGDWPTVIARYGDDGDQYKSGIPAAKNGDPDLKEALDRATRQGLIKEDIK